MKRFLIALAFVCLPVLARAQATVALAPVPRQIFFSASGSPLSLGCVFTWAAGTSTFLASYTDSSGLTANPDPLQLGLDGGASIWFTGVGYKVGVYQNPTGGACPGTPGGSLALVYTVDGITTSTGSGSSTANQLTSAGANPATSGIARLTKSDTICFRNAGNSANVCASLDSANNLTWSGVSFACTEGTAPSGISGEDILYCDPTAHRFKMTNNAGSGVQVVASGADISTSDTVTSTHLSSALPVAQGGTGNSGSGGNVALTNAALTTPNIGGNTISNVPWLEGSARFESSSINASNTNPFFVFNVAGGAITIKEFDLAFLISVSGCSSFPSYVLYDETAASALSTITISNGTLLYRNTGLSASVANNHVLDIHQSAGGSMCSTSPNGSFSFMYQMQ